MAPARFGPLVGHFSPAFASLYPQLVRKEPEAVATPIEQAAAVQAPVATAAAPAQSKGFFSWLRRKKDQAPSAAAPAPASAPAPAGPVAEAAEPADSSPQILLEGPASQPLRRVGVASMAAAVELAQPSGPSRAVRMSMLPEASGPATVESSKHPANV
jgi:hypothetical protein